MTNDFRSIIGRPDLNRDIPNDPFGSRGVQKPEVLIQTINGNLSIPGAIVDENVLKVTATEFLVGGLDFGTF